LEQQVVYTVSRSYPIEEVLSCFDPATTVYFFEPMRVKGVEPAAHDNMRGPSTLATVSPDRSRYHEFKKVATMVHMPVFAENELLAIGRDTKSRLDFDDTLAALYTDDAIRDRFKSYNGIIRHVLPTTVGALGQTKRATDEAVENIQPVQFLTGNLENQIVSHYVAVYNVNQSDFSPAGLKLVNDNAFNKVKSRFMDESMANQIQILQRYREMGHDPLVGIPAKLFENVVALHLTSAIGVRWHSRHAIVSAGSKSSKKKKTTEIRGEEPLMPLKLQLRKLVKGEVPPYAAMTPNVLYKSLNDGFPMCDLVYKDGGGKLVCIQVSLKQSGKREVGVGAFKKFCKRMGWKAQPSKDQLRLISFVYCPDPMLADAADVDFEGGIELDSHTVWHMDTDFGSGVDDDSQ
jgi:hypothetical protein